MSPAPEEVGVELRLAAVTHPGRVRKENQDSYLVLSMPSDSDAPRILHSRPVAGEDGVAEVDRTLVPGPRGCVLVVADGMGGAAAGATASSQAVLRVADRVLSGWNRAGAHTADAFARNLKEAVETANAHLFQMASDDPALDGMGTTLTAAGILGSTIYLAQVGDSRAYLVRDGRTVQLTRDQSVVQQMLDAGALTAAEARRSPQRHVLLQALGVAPDVRVDLTWQRLREGDLLLLCSDGLTGPVDDEAIGTEAGRHSAPLDLCRALVDLANDGGGPDNITVLAARASGPGLEAPVESDRVGRQPFHPADSGAA
ncbi:MAG: serine/threonine-protein phosphatase [Gemmatimonadales bacterium]|nr:MAG: serine/threonine-protein phosphatase [Gemmatimonadales bacterium]